jgi:glucose-6-phosphate isomerase
MKTLELWQHYQDWLYLNEGLGLYLDVSRMRFDESLVAKLEPKFAQAFKDMAALEQGAIANPDENRMVGHYWLRNPEIAPLEMRNEIMDSLDQIEVFVRKIHDGSIHPPLAPKFTDVLSVGIGGSALGPQFVDDALAPDFPPLAIHFIDNTDPAGIDRILNRLKDRLNSTLVIVTSKSGGTPETRNGMLEVRHAYEQQGLNFPDYAVAVTMLGSKMDELERLEGWLEEFPMFDWVGGRTSEMSTVGLLSASLLGIDIRALLEGAKQMDIATRMPEVRRNPAALLALCWYYAGNGKGEKDMVVLPYKDSLLLFSRYLQQLLMESLGKEKDLDGNTVHQGITVYGNKGSGSACLCTTVAGRGGQLFRCFYRSAGRPERIVHRSRARCDIRRLSFRIFAGYAAGALRKRPRLDYGNDYPGEPPHGWRPDRPVREGRRALCLAGEHQCV